MSEDRRSGAGLRLYLRNGFAFGGMAIGVVEPSPLYATVYRRSVSGRTGSSMSVRA
jgi:hypothetical protein